MKSRILLGALFLGIVFLALRLPAIHLPYHQDEAKNVVWSTTVKQAGIYYAHPPLMQMIFVADYKIFGPEDFRFMPLIFSILACVALYFVVKRRAGTAAAWWSAGLFAVCFYNIFGSIQPDVDGSVLPLFLLLAIYAYDRFNDAPLGSRRKWFDLLALVCFLGFLVKLNFVLAIGTLVVDYLWRWRSLKARDYGSLLAIGAGFGAVYVGLLYLIQALYPAFSIQTMLGHANQFTGDEGRNWIQIAVQGIKAIQYLSPLLIVPVLFASKEVFRKSRPFWIYLGLGFIFYFVLFDFSRGALDKYLMFAIVPLAVMSGMVFADAFKGGSPSRYRWPLIGGALASAVLVALNFLPQTIAGLYPKTEWFGRVLHGQWNVLTPFMGGSGPIGFYVSFLFIAGGFIACILIAAVAFFKKEWRRGALAAILVIGASYNLVFAEELLYGKINGSSPDVLRAAIAYIRDNPSITQVMTYNDIGNHELTNLGKYARRIYAIPDSEEGYRALFAKYTGHYLVVDVPHLYDTGFYGRFFARCKPIFETVSGRISGKVYDCSEPTKIINTI